MKRREFIILLGGAIAYPLSAGAQGRPRIGVLSINSARAEGDNIAAFVQGLHMMGYAEGVNIDIDYRYAEGDSARLTRLAEELIARKLDVGLVNSISPAVAMKGVAPGLPIVCAALGDSAIPLLAASHARPAGNVTGIASNVENLYAKFVELALDIVPGALRIGFLANPAGGSMALYKQQVDIAARARGVMMLTQEVRTADDLAPAYAWFSKEHAQAIIIPANGLFTTNNAHIAQLGLTARLPTIFPERRDIEAGGLASYGVDLRENFRRAATYVDKILKGAKPGDLPIEFPTKLVLIINLKSAKTLGVSVPATMIGRADEVIE